MEEWTEPEDVERAEWECKSKGSGVGTKEKKFSLLANETAFSPLLILLPPRFERAGA